MRPRGDDGPISDQGMLRMDEIVYGDRFTRGYVTVTTRSTGGGSDTILTECVAMATGRALLGVEPGEPKRVWIISSGDPREEITAIYKRYNIPGADIGVMLVDRGRQQPLIVKDLTAEMLAERIDVLVIDPFILPDEDDRGAVDRTMQEFTRMAKITNAAIELVCDTRKSSGPRTDARGGSISAVRHIRNTGVVQ
jgi:RecA-family ATPase